MSNSVFLNYGTSYFDLLSQRIDDNEAEITDIDFLKLNKPDPITPNALLYVVDTEGNTGSSEILCQSNNALQSVGCLQLPGTAVNPATIIPELSGQSATTVWLNSGNGHLYRGSVDLESGGGGGDVFGPAICNDNAIARFDTSTGKLLQNSLVRIADGGAITMPIIDRQIEMGSNTLMDMRPASSFVGLGRVSNNDNLIMIGFPPGSDSNAVDDGLFIGNNSCGTSSDPQTDVFAFGHDIGTPSGSKTIVIGNRICLLPSAISSLGVSNIAMGHDIDIRNNSLGNLIFGNSAKVRGNANVIMGEKVFNGGGITNSNCVFGYEAGKSLTGNANNNVLMGTSALGNAVNASSGNVLIGASIGLGITTGINDCLWLEADGVNGETNTTRIGKSSKTACYVNGIFGSSVGTSGFTVKTDSVGKLFSSTVSRPCISSVSYGADSGDAFDFTTSFTVMAFGSATNSYVDVVGFTNPAPGKYQYNGLFTGDTTSRKFRITCFINHGVYVNEASISFAVNNVPVGGDYRLQTSSATGCLAMGDVITLVPGQYASVVAKSLVAGAMDVYKMSVFMELLK